MRARRRGTTRCAVAFLTKELAGLRPAGVIRGPDGRYAAVGGLRHSLRARELENGRSVAAAAAAAPRTGIGTLVLRDGHTQRCRGELGLGAEGGRCLAAPPRVRGPDAMVPALERSVKASHVRMDGSIRDKLLRLRVRIILG